MPGGESAKKLFAKSQPLETFQWKEHSDAPLAPNSLALQQCSQGHILASEREGILTSSRGSDDIVDSNQEHHVEKSCGFSVKQEVMKTRKSSRNIKTEAVLNGSLNDPNFMNVVKGSDLFDGSISCSGCSHLPFETEYSDFKKSENLRCSGEQMEGHSRIPSKSNSVQSLTGHENSLGKTLATSLKLIAANSATSPLAHSSVHSDGESFQAETVSCTSNSNASDAVTPVVVLSPAEPSGQSDKAKLKKHPTRASLKRAKKLAKKKSSDSEMKKCVERKNETLYQCEKCSKAFYKKQTLQQHVITHFDRVARPYCDTRCRSKGDFHSAKADNAAAYSAKVDSAKADSVTADGVKVDSENAESAKAYSAKAESVKADSEIADSAKVDKAKADSENADSAKVDCEHADSAKADRAKADSAKAVRAKAHRPKQKVPRHVKC
ncbi:hypothetical protein BsWGS_28022 [Bradybaena similaris]